MTYQDEVRIRNPNDPWQREWGTDYHSLAAAIMAGIISSEQLTPPREQVRAVSPRTRPLLGKMAHPRLFKDICWHVAPAQKPKNQEDQGYAHRTQHIRQRHHHSTFRRGGENHGGIAGHGGKGHRSECLR